MVKEYEDVHNCKNQTGSIQKWNGVWVRIENWGNTPITECPYCGRVLK
jgi:uncharacterized Zn-finger protein